MSYLIDRQAFIENERKLYCEDCDRRKGTKNGKPNVICYEIGEVPCRSCWLYDALDDLEDFPAASPWHRVEEELPEIGQIVLVYDECRRLSICQLDNSYRWLRQGGGFFDTPYVRYWMPIPAEPPKEEA